MTDIGKRVGERVRKARRSHGYPRRVLSERSGVSQRYLAQLEAGEGNISISLLDRVATALDRDIGWFLEDGSAPHEDPQGIAELFQSANKDQKSEVLRLLAPQNERFGRANRVCLLGLRGAGKSSLGQKIGNTLGIEFVELNQAIEQRCGVPVGEVMALYGQEGYREQEASALEDVIASNDKLILAVAGGIVAVPETYERLLSRFHTIWLQATPEEHMARVRAQGDYRPMTGNPEAMQQLRSILKDRETAYGRADIRLETSGKTLGQSSDELLTLIETRRFLA